MPLNRPVSLLVALACVGSAVGADQDPVNVKDISVRPMANLTADNGTLVLHPKVLLGVGFNDNIFATETNEKDDVYGRGLVGLTADWRLNPHNSLAFNGEFEGLHYSKSENENGNMVGGLAEADYKWREAKNEGTIHGGYARFDDPLVETGQQILRENFIGSGSLTMQGSEMRTVANANITATNYLEDGLGFTSDSRDNSVYSAMGRFGITTARDTYYYALIGGDRVEYWDSNQFNNSWGVKAGLGSQVRLGDRSSLTAEAGVDYRVYDDYFNKSATYDDKTIIGPYVNIAARWPWETGSHVGLKAFSRLDESLTANAALVYGGGLDGRYRLLAHSALFAAANIYHSEDSGQGAGIATETRDTIDVSGGIEHEMCKGVVGRLKAVYTDSDSENSNSFTRLVTAFDLAIAF
jgi:hypothetical protein